MEKAINLERKGEIHRDKENGSVAVIVPISLKLNGVNIAEYPHARQFHNNHPKNDMPMPMLVSTR